MASVRISLATWAIVIASLSLQGEITGVGQVTAQNGRLPIFTPPPGEGYPRPTIVNGIIYNLFHIPPRCRDPRVYTYPTGGIIIDKRALIKAENPHKIKGNIEISPTGCLYIEPGTILHFAPGYGLRVNGTLIAWGSPDERITFTKDPDTSYGEPIPWPDGARLVDGNTTLDGRLELMYHGKWRGICTNYVNFTKLDANVTCRSLGFLKGNFTYHSFAKNVSDYILYERPACNGDENDLLNCPGRNDVRMGSHVCDGQQVIGFECEGLRPDMALDHWRGIEFINATADEVRLENSRIILNESLSRIEYADISYAGVDTMRDATKGIRHPMATISANPHPPNINEITLKYGAHDAFNYTDLVGSVRIANSTISHNRGHGIYVLSNVGRMLVNTTNITNNWGDGIKFHMINYTIPRYRDQFPTNGEFCGSIIPDTPLPLFAYQDLMGLHGDTPIWGQPCYQRYRTVPGRAITVHFLLFERDPRASATLRIYDGSSEFVDEIMAVEITNGSYPQSVTSTGNEIYLKLTWNVPNDRRCPTYKPCLRFLLEVVGEYGPDPEFRLINSSVSNNTMHGVNIHNMRSKVFFNTTEVCFNNYEAGIRVFEGAGEVAINNTLIKENALAGVNITYSGGYILFNNSQVISNKGYGVITEYDIVNRTRYETRQKMEVVRTDFELNQWIAFRIGNYCKNSHILINESNFRYNLDEAIEYLSCNRSNAQMTNFSLAFNLFENNRRHSVLMAPMLYTMGIMTNNTFRNHSMGVIRIDNGDDLLISRWYAYFPVNYNFFENDFEENSGRYVVSMRLTQSSPSQKIFFKFNRLRNNYIQETFQSLNPRSRANAVAVLSSGGVTFQRNWVENPGSAREVSTHLTDPSVLINASLNWWGTANHAEIYDMIFDRDDRYNLAIVDYYPALQFNRPYEDYTTILIPRHIWQFNRGDRLGGVLEHPGFSTNANIDTYYVDKDIYLNPGVPFFILPGTTLFFDTSLGMVVYGRLVADGLDKAPFTPVNFALDEQEIFLENVTASVRLVDGIDQFEGRLEVDIDDVWGTVCNEGWVDENAALACQQLGLTYNPKYAQPRRRIIGSAGQPVHLADVQCGEMDMDLANCKAERLQNSSPTYCNHSQDVIIRCHPPTWSGITIPAVPKGSQYKETQIRLATIRQAGLMDAATMEYSPGLRIDYDYHVITNLTVENCVSDGIQVRFTHPVSENRLESCKVLNNLGSGILTRDTFLEISYTMVRGNGEAGLRFDPFFTEYEALSVRNSIHMDHRIDMLSSSTYLVGTGSMSFLVTNPTNASLPGGFHDLEIDAGNTFRLILQIMDYNPLTEHEKVTVFDSRKSSINSKTKNWTIEEDLVDFPITSTSRYLTIRLQASGVISGRLTFAAHSTTYSTGQDTRLFVRNCTFSDNKQGIVTKHYNNPSNYRQEIFFRHKHEIFEFYLVVVMNNKQEAMHIPSVTKYDQNYIPSYEEMTTPQRVAVIEYIMEYCTFDRNVYGIIAEHNHVDFANNVWHWRMNRNSITNNANGGFQLELPRVNDRLEREKHRFTMTDVLLENNKNFAFTINGYYANVSITRNSFKNNECLLGLVSLSGMEKELSFRRNLFSNNIGKYVIDFNMVSHSEYLANVPGVFEYNDIRSNRPDSNVPIISNQPNTYAVAFRGVQNVIANRNLIDNANMQYELVAGITALSLENTINVKENWWGSTNQFQIKQRIFDFDDWNNFALASYTPYLSTAEFETTTIPGSPIDDEISLERLGGRVMNDFTIPSSSEPYIVHSDLTVMSGATLRIPAGTELQFKPNIGILVLGNLEAKGLLYSRIKMGPIPKPGLSNNSNRKRRAASTTIRFVGGMNADEGFLELYNASSKSYNLMCDHQFNEKTAEVVCRELGKETINVEVRFTHLYDHYVYGRPMYFRKEFWANSFYCKGDEDHLNQCQKRINFNLLQCVYAANYTFIRCGERNLDPKYEYWGNIRFAPSSHEETSIIVDDPNRRRSHMEYVDIVGAGILHGEKVGAIQATYLAPIMQHLNISKCASNAMDYIAPRENLLASTINITDNLGYGVNVLVLNGESRHDSKSSFEPLVTSSIPYNLFGMVEICRMEKEITVNERMILFYKYSHESRDCVKIITSNSPLNRVSLRFLQVNLYNDSFSRNAIEIFDGKQVSDTSMMAEITSSSDPEAVMRSYTTTTQDRTLIVHMHATPGQWSYGFIAEVVTLPLSGTSYPDSSYHHRFENSILKGNQDGAILYRNVGEVTPSLFIERCWIESNGVAILNLTSWPAVDIGIQDTLVFKFGNNFIMKNKGGMQLVGKTASIATRANMTITNNVFAFTTNGEALNISGHHYQRAYVYENDFFNNTAGDWRHVINIENVLVNFTFNVVTNNYGHHILGAYSAEGVKTEQLYTKNIFADNNASAEFSATILAGRGQPKIMENYLVNPLCDFELLAGSKIQLPNNQGVQDTPVNASRNWWGSWIGTFISGKIWDVNDNDRLITVNYLPAKPDNSSFLEGKCPAGWRLDDQRCYRFFGGALNYEAAKSFCGEQGGAFLAEPKNRERFLNYVVRTSQNNYQPDVKVWVYGSVAPGRCSSFKEIYVVEEEDCARIMLPFICEKDPYIVPPDDEGVVLALGIAGGVVGLALLIVVIFVILWIVKSRRRKDERLERTASIRGSKMSIRSKSAETILSDHSRRTARSVDEYLNEPEQRGRGRGRGMHLAGVTTAETSTETLDKPRMNGYYFDDRSRSHTPESKSDSHSKRSEPYLNSAYRGESTPDEDEYDDDYEKSYNSEDDDNDEGVGKDEFDDDNEDSISQKTVETTDDKQDEEDYYGGPAPPPYQYHAPRVENEISSMHRTPVDDRLYSNTSLDDRSVDLSSNKSKSNGNLSTFAPPTSLHGSSTAIERSTQNLYDRYSPSGDPAARHSPAPSYHSVDNTGSQGSLHNLAAPNEERVVRYSPHRPTPPPVAQPYYTPNSRVGSQGSLHQIVPSHEQPAVHHSPAPSYVPQFGQSYRPNERSASQGSLHQLSPPRDEPLVRHSPAPPYVSTFAQSYRPNERSASQGSLHQLNPPRDEPLVRHSPAPPYGAPNRQPYQSKERVGSQGSLHQINAPFDEPVVRYSPAPPHSTANRQSYQPTEPTGSQGSLHNGILPSVRPPYRRREYESEQPNEARQSPNPRQPLETVL